MAQCQLAVTAGGTTIYELAVLGVPFVCFSYAENQEALTEWLGTQQIAGYAGAWHPGCRGDTGAHWSVVSKGTEGSRTASAML